VKKLPRDVQSDVNNLWNSAKIQFKGKEEEFVSYIVGKTKELLVESTRQKAAMVKYFAKVSDLVFIYLGYVLSSFVNGSPPVNSCLLTILVYNLYLLMLK